jgi:hypothetical protein
VDVATFKQRMMLRLINFWPPLAAAGIHVQWGPGIKSADVSMKMRSWNRNFVGTHYGGSLYSMTDPFYMLMLIENLGPDYIVWDKAASIRFRRPGKGRVTGQIRLIQQQIDQIRRGLETEEKMEPTFSVEIRDDSGSVVAEVQKVLHIKKKP